VSLLEPCELAPDDLDAHADAPRPGTWFGEDCADGRALSQQGTDLLIVAELLARAAEVDRPELLRLAGTPHPIPMILGEGVESLVAFGHVQRGGIHSDPRVRVLAVRCWGQRDRRWPELQGMTDDAIAHHLRDRFAFAWLRIDRDRDRSVDTTTLIAQDRRYFAAIRLSDHAAAPSRAELLTRACSQLKNLVIYAPSVPQRIELQRPTTMDESLRAARDPTEREFMERELAESAFRRVLVHSGVNAPLYLDRKAG
jgi:hypothetical protein